MIRDLDVERGLPILRPGQAAREDGEPRELVPGFAYRYRAPGDTVYRGTGTMVGSYSEAVGDNVVGMVRLERPGGRRGEVTEAQVGPAVPARRPIAGI